MTTVDEQRIAELLRSAPVPEPRVDLSRAVRDGRRRRQRRRVGGIAALTVLAGVGVVGAVQVGGTTSPPVPTTPALAVSPAETGSAAPARRSPARRRGCRSRSTVRSRWPTGSIPPGGTSSATSAPGRRTDGSCCGPTAGRSSCRPTARHAAAVNAGGDRGRHQRRRHRLAVPGREAAFPGHPTRLRRGARARRQRPGRHRRHRPQVRRLAPGCAVVDGPAPEVPAGRPAGVVRDRDHRGRHDRRHVGATALPVDAAGRRGGAGSARRLPAGVGRLGAGRMGDRHGSRRPSRAAPCRCCRCGGISPPGR